MTRVQDMEEKTVVLTNEDAAQKITAVIGSGELFPLKVTGNSMRPFLRDGRDTVWLKAPEEIRRGDIVFFRRGDGSFILHRVRKILSDGKLLVNGDAQAWCETVEEKNVIAKVSGITCEGKTVSADSPRLRFFSALWYPTRPLRPALFRICTRIKTQ